MRRFLKIRSSFSIIVTRSSIVSGFVSSPAATPGVVFNVSCFRLTKGGFLLALGRSRTSKSVEPNLVGDDLPAFLRANNLKPFIDEDLALASRHIEFRLKEGGRAFGYAAEILPRVCGVFLDARAVLTHNQAHIAETALVLIRGLANTGIVALIDEATGYQYDRPRKDLEEYLSKFLSENLRRWVQTFPSDYFKHLCRLRGVELRHDMRLPQYFGVLTNNLVYKRIAPGILKALKHRRAERGNPSNKLHSWLSDDVGVREVLVHLGTVVGLMKIHTNYDEFEKQLNKIAPIYPDSPAIWDNPDDWKERA